MNDVETVDLEGPQRSATTNRLLWLMTNKEAEMFVHYAFEPTSQCMPEDSGWFTFPRDTRVNVVRTCDNGNVITRLGGHLVYIDPEWLDFGVEDFDWPDDIQIERHTIHGG